MEPNELKNELSKQETFHQILFNLVCGQIYYVATNIQFNKNLQ